jgi:hypothetical protein
MQQTERHTLLHRPESCRRKESSIDFPAFPRKKLKHVVTSHTKETALSISSFAIACIRDRFMGSKIKSSAFIRAGECGGDGVGGGSRQSRVSCS